MALASTRSAARDALVRTSRKLHPICTAANSVTDKNSAELVVAMAARLPRTMTASMSCAMTASGTPAAATLTAVAWVSRSPSEKPSCHVVGKRIIRSQTAPMAMAPPRARARMSARPRTNCHPSEARSSSAKAIRVSIRLAPEMESKDSEMTPKT